MEEESGLDGEAAERMKSGGVERESQEEKERIREEEGRQAGGC